MIFPPSIVRVRIEKQGKRHLRLWLPVVLLWPVLLAIFLVLLPVVVLIAPCFGRGGILFLRSLPLLLELLCRVRGLHVDVADGSGRILVSIR